MTCRELENRELSPYHSYREMSRGFSPSTSYKDNSILAAKSREQKAHSFCLPQKVKYKVGSKEPSFCFLHRFVQRLLPSASCKEQEIKYSIPLLPTKYREQNSTSYKEMGKMLPPFYFLQTEISAPLYLLQRESSPLLHACTSTQSREQTVGN